MPSERRPRPRDDVQSINPPSGSTVAVEMTTRAVRQFAILDTELGSLTNLSVVATLCFGLATLAAGFAGSCWLVLQDATTLDPVATARIDMAERAGFVGAIVFFVLTVAFGIREGTLIYRIRKNSQKLTLGGH